MKKNLMNAMNIINSLNSQYRMDWDAIQANDATKAMVLEQWWEELGQLPQKHSTPVFDCNTWRVYPSYALGLEVGALYHRYYHAVLQSIETGMPLKTYKEDVMGVNGHQFIPVDSVDTAILRVALSSYKRKNFEMEKLSEIQETLSEIIGK